MRRDVFDDTARNDDTFDDGLGGDLPVLMCREKDVAGRW